MEKTTTTTRRTTVYSTVHFTFTGGNEAGVDLVLIQPFLLYYVNHVVLYMLTGIFWVFFKQTFHKKRKVVCTKHMRIESMRGMVPQAFFRNAGCREHQRWKCTMLNVEISLSVQALFLILLHTIYVQCCGSRDQICFTRIGLLSRQKQ